MNEKQAINRILKVLGALNYSGNHDKVKALVKQGIASEINSLEITFLILSHFGKKKVATKLITPHVNTLMQLFQ
ncbi:hypothetical protein BWI97_08805 [Siphonobacter sp. BAB-5405]|uniref:hypothetical protein n=1 Tax=Siphonobacter sp. BAB-5405 TaxID=1864825 RepID=UPI000C80FBA8|nr:hypothetical protein [Siphonobacter sp. BAB-5405]PMD97699.1 hypothetical protein BWI97_08805 [Siphonobacter sp. BAB-5405]